MCSVSSTLPSLNRTVYSYPMLVGKGNMKAAKPTSRKQQKNYPNDIPSECKLIEFAQRTAKGEEYL